MGYIDDQAITIDAVLTKRGRELLVSGELFEVPHPSQTVSSPIAISRWSVSDDGVDYRLWNDLSDQAQPIFKPPNSTNPNDITGYTKDERALSIEQLPILEPNPSGIRHMRNKLISADQTITNMPIGSLQTTDINTGAIMVNVFSYKLFAGQIFSANNNEGLVLFPVQINPSIPPPNNAFMGRFGYTVVVRDASLLSIVGFSNPNPPLNFVNPRMGNLNGKDTATVSSNFFMLMPRDYGDPVGTIAKTVVYIYDNELGFEIPIEIEVEIAP